MKLVYKPEGADPQEWEFDPARLMSPEVEAIERHTGFTFQQWAEGIGNGSFTALHGLLYVLLKRTHPTLRWDDVQFCMADLDFEMSEEETAQVVQELTTKRTEGTLTADEAAVLDRLVAEREGAGAAAPKG